MVNETLPALVKLREQGLVRFIGITGLPLKIFPYILDRLACPYQPYTMQASFKSGHNICNRAC